MENNFSLSLEPHIEEQIARFNPNTVIPISLRNIDEDAGISRSSIVGYSAEIPLQFLYSAYLQGIFPWFSEDNGEPVIWWCPSPRFVLFPQDLHIPQSVKKILKKKPFTYTYDTCFERVIRECATAYRNGQDGTWIGEKIIASYTALHRVGFAHSIEVWSENELAGGFYGVLLGSVFCGESMFTKIPNATKCAFVQFVEAFASIGGKMIDCQVYTDNMARYGAKNISRSAFLHYEKDFISKSLSADLEKTFLEYAL